MSFLTPRRVGAALATALTLFTIGTASAATNNVANITLNAILLMFGGAISTSHNDVSTTQVCGTGPCAQSKTNTMTATTDCKMFSTK